VFIVMLILAFDTTSQRGGAAIYRDRECLADIANDSPANRSSVTLFQTVDRLVAEAQARLGVPAFTLRDIDLYAVAIGPGSFTGIRVGVAAAQGWARAFDRPVCGVTVLEAMVAQAQPEADYAVPILDAHRGEFYLSVFRRVASEDGGTFAAVSEGRVLKLEALAPFLAEQVPDGTSTVCLTRENDQAALALRDVFPQALHWQAVSGTLVEGITRRALEAHRNGELQTPAELDAYYLRRTDAELNWRG
jgi:tRNA threonylcarbamoyladenosine biosynthesis protein TsaB